ncbi:MAG: DUF2029 domain-containing protein [Acidobacteria bacterium]|nr:DUF2029 domain-containing protein [Acidobacteriota bacterium]
MQRTFVEPGRDRNGLWLGAVALAVLTLLFLGQYWNHFLALRTSFGSSFIAQLMAEGRTPYKDFFLMVPPLQFLKTQLIASVFGHELIIPFIVAVLERVILGLVVYFWLSAYFRPADAFLSSLTALAVSFGDGADMMTSYNHAPTILWIVLAGWFADLGLRSTRWAFLSGVAAGICLGMKQTLGLGATAMVPILAAVILWRRGESNRFRTFLAAFAAGWILPVAGLGYWLWSHDILSAFLEMNYGSGISGKGSPAQILLRPVTLTLDRLALAVSAALGFVLVGMYWFAARRRDNGSGWGLPLLVTLAAVSISLGIVTGGLGIDRPGWGRDILVKGVVYGVLFGTIGQNLYYFVVATRRRLTAYEETSWIQAGMSFGVAFTLCLSWPAFEPMVFPGLAVLLAPLFSKVRLATVAACCFLLYSMMVIKLETPFTWDGWSDAPVRGELVASEHPLLKGFRFPKETADFATHVTDTIRAHSSKEDPVFIYPGLVAFYLLADRRPPTFAYDHTMDIGPDWLCRQDAARLLAAPPAVIVEYTPPKETLADKEAVWRSGKPSGQRDLVAAIRKLTPEYPFHEALTTRGGGKLDIWAKR